MRASDFDAIIDCPECDGEGCLFCDDGEFSYYAPANPAEPDREVLIYGVSSVRGAVKKMMPSNRVNLLASDETKSAPTDDNGNITVPRDIADRMENKLGANAPYQINGNKITDSDLPSGWPDDSDLTPDVVVAWLEARGSTDLAASLRTAMNNLGW